MYNENHRHKIPFSIVRHLIATHTEIVVHAIVGSGHPGLRMGLSKEPLGFAAVVIDATGIDEEGPDLKQIGGPVCQCMSPNA